MEKPRYRLLLEQSFCSIGILLGIVGGNFLHPWFFLLSIPSWLHFRRVFKALKIRNEPLTNAQKSTLFMIQGVFCSAVIICLLLLALSRQTPVLWIVFGLVSTVMAGSLALEYWQHFRKNNAA